MAKLDGTAYTVKEIVKHPAMARGGASGCDMRILAAAAPSLSWWSLAVLAVLGAGIFLVWFHFRKIRSLRQIMDSEERLKDLMNQVPVGVVAYRNRTLVYANEACLALFGLPSVEEMSRRSPMEFFAPSERERILGYIAARELGQAAPTSYEVSAVRASGEPFPMSVHIAQAELRDGPAILMFLEDATESHAARVALEKSEQDYRGLFEGAHDAILLFEPDGERILDANERAGQMYGLPRDQLVGKSLLDFSTDAATGSERIQELQSKGVLSEFQTIHRRPDGGLITLDVNASMVGYKGRRAILSIHRDISDRIKAADALRRSEENYRLLVENQTDLVVKTDSEGRFLFVSHSLCELFGKAEAELMGKAFLDLVSEEDRHASMKAMKALAVWPHTARFDQRAMTARGSRWISWNHRAVLDSEGRTSAVVGVGRDVTERKAVEEALKESEQIFRALAESSSVTIAIYQDERLVYTNPSAEKLSGYTAEELAGMPLADLMHPDFRELLLKRARARERGEPVLSQYEAPLLRKDGGTRWLLVSAARVTYKGQPAGILAAFDVTERRTAEERVRQTAHEIQAIFKALPDEYFRLDAGGRILDWRSGSEEDLLRPEKIAGKLIQEVVPPDAAEVLVRALREILGGARTAVAEYGLKLPQGDQHFEARLAPLFGNQVVAVVRNVTQRRRTESDLRDALKRVGDEKARTEGVLAAIGDGISIQDLDFKIIYQNEVHRGLIGNHIGENCYSAYEGRERVCEECPVAMAYADGKVHTLERSVRSGGALTVVEITASPLKDSTGAIVGGIESVRDMTERKRTEEALRARLKQSRALVENAQAVILQFDPDLTITYWNDYAAKFFGFTREEILGANLLDTIVPRTESSGRDLAVLIREIAHDPNRYAANINENLTKTGGRVWVAWSNRPMVDARGRLTGILSIGTDITGLKDAEEGLRRTNRQLLAVASSAQAMGKFTDVQTATRSICEAAINALGASMAWVGLVVPESTEITPLSSAGRDEGYTETVRVRWDLSPRAMGPTGRAVKTRNLQVMRVEDPAFAPWREEAAKRGYRIVCALPLLHQEEVRGAITLYSEDPGAFGEETFDILDIFARQSAMVLVSASLYEEAQRTIHELWEANEELKKG